MAKSYGSSARHARTAGKEGRMRNRRPSDSDVPPLSDGQLATLRSVGRPTIGTAARQLIAIRIDPDVLDTVRREADRRAVGYQTLINDILGRYVRERQRQYDARATTPRASKTRRAQQ